MTAVCRLTNELYIYARDYDRTGPSVMKNSLHSMPKKYEFSILYGFYSLHLYSFFSPNFALFCAVLISGIAHTQGDNSSHESPIMCPCDLLKYYYD